MRTIVNSNTTTDYTTDDGRIVCTTYCNGQQQITIEHRPAFAGYFQDPGTYVQTKEQVPAADWEIACQLMIAASRAFEAEGERRRQAAVRRANERDATQPTSDHYRRSLVGHESSPEDGDVI